MGLLTQMLGNRPLTWFTTLWVVIFLYGSMALKYVAGAICFYQGVSYLIYGNTQEILLKIPSAYYISIGIFFVINMYFSFGDIKDTKGLQAFVAVMRFVVIIMMIVSSVFYIVDEGPRTAPVFDWSTQLPHLATVFGNTVFSFIYQPASPGIIFPVRPQCKIP
jgi:amino acid permease